MYPQIWYTGLTEMSCRIICFMRMTGISWKHKCFSTYCEKFSVIKKSRKQERFLSARNVKQKAIAKAQGRRDRLP